MKLKRFSLYEDLDSINQWLAKRDTPPVTRHALPEIGYMAWHHNKPVAAIFLRRCEGRTGIVDSLITNPEESPEVRNFALDELIKFIIEKAPKYNITHLLGFSRDENTITRATRLGFVQSPYTVVAMELSKQESK